MNKKVIKFEMKKVAKSLKKHFGFYVTQEKWEKQCEIEATKAMERMEKLEADKKATNTNTNKEEK
jgi:hypothetical protein